MARKFTVTQLMTRARERADMLNTDFITDPELRGYLSASFAELFDILIQSGLLYFTPGELEFSGNGTELYPLPEDFYGVLRVDYQYVGDYWTELDEYMETERNVFENVTSGSTSGWATHYSCQGDSISLLPRPSQGTYRLRYIPNPPDLADGDPDVTKVDGISGWEEWVIVDAARKMLSKEESSTASVERDLARLKERIEEASLNREWGSPRRIIDTRHKGRRDWWRNAETS